jgi:signal transduction histidine kinase
VAGRQHFRFEDRQVGLIAAIEIFGSTEGNDSGEEVSVVIIVKLPHRIELLARVRLHSEAYIHELQRQRAYRALEASQRELTEKNCELELLNQKLEEATRFRSIFFANVSHEVRTPLIGVLGMAEILSDSRLPPVPHQHKGRPIKRLTKFWIFH